MKKLFPIAIVAFAAMTFTSCKKDYTCTCTATVGGVSMSSSATIHDTKSNAKSKCETSGSTYGATYTCALN